MSLVWERNGEAYYATVSEPGGTARFRLIVEPLPDGTWDWSVWSPNGSFEAHGVAATAHAAMVIVEKCLQPGGPAVP